MRWFQLHLLSVLAALSSIIVAAPMALAGGWAVTTLDELPGTILASETYSIGYTIRQHGQTPFTTAQSAIEIHLPRTGATVRFAGEADGAPGHYVAEMRFPEAGEWEWVADQTPFARQPLGTISVLSSPDSSNSPITPARTQLAIEPALRLGLPVASLLALVVFGWRSVRQRIASTPWQDCEALSPRACSLWYCSARRRWSSPPRADPRR